MLKINDYERLLASVQELHALGDLADFRQRVTHIVRNLVRATCVSYNEIDPQLKTAIGVFDDPVAEREVMRHWHLWEQYCHQHPVLHYFRQNPHACCQKISDCLTQQQFHELPLYQEFYSVVGLEYQFALNVVDEHAVVGIVSNRYGKDEYDFDEYDRQMLALLQPHVQNAYTRLRTRHGLQLLLDGPLTEELVLELRRIGLTDREGQILYYLFLGHTNKQIALHMQLSEGTVRKHVEHLLSKLGATSRTGACREAMRRLAGS